MKLSWHLGTTFVDGSPFGQKDYKGVDLSLDGGAAVSIPAAWAPDNNYEFLVDSLQPAAGSHTFRVRTVAADGTPSDWTAPVSGVYEKKPPSPLGLTVS